MVVELIAILKRRTIDFGGHLACVYETLYICGKSITELLDLKRCLPRYPSLPPGNEETGIPFRPPQPLLERSTEGSGQATAVPIESQYTAEGLKPEGIREPPQHLQRTELVDDNEAYLPSQILHPPEEPNRCPSVMEGKVGCTHSHGLSPKSALPFCSVAVLR